MINLWLHDFFHLNVDIYERFLRFGFKPHVLTLPHRQFVQLDPQVHKLFKYVIPWDSFSYPHLEKSYNSLSDIKLTSLIEELSTNKPLFFEHAYDPILLHQAERSYYGGSCFLDKSFHNILLSLRWSEILSFSDIDFFVSANIPHLADDTIIFNTIKKFNVPILRCHMHWSFKSCFWATFNNKLVTHKLPPSSFIDSELSSTLSHFNKTGIFFNPSNVRKDSIREYMFDRSVASSLNRYPDSYLSCISSSIPSSSFRICIFLHSEPEARQNPGGLPFLDQKLLILILSKLFPSAQIVIKEHPDMFDPNFNILPYTSSDKYPYLRSGLLSLISSLDNVYLAPPTLSTPVLLKSSKLSSAFTGSVVVESLLLGVPCFSPGDFFFQVFPGIIRDINSLNYENISLLHSKLSSMTSRQILFSLQRCMFPGLLRADHHFNYSIDEHLELAKSSVSYISYILSMWLK